MKKRFITNITLFLVLLPTFVRAQIVADSSFRMINSKTAVISNRTSFDTGSHILPVAVNQNISGISVSGNITFTGDKGFVRIVLTDTNENDYLVLETNTIFEQNTSISFNEFCEETALLNNVVPKQITIECTDARVAINGIQYAASNGYQTSRSKQIKEKQLDAKLQHINTVLAQKEITWGAGKTSLSEMSYMEKKDYYGGKLPNLAGFDYYVSGIYVMQGYQPDSISVSNNTRSQFVSEFDWRNRHGRNWITSVKNQGNCNSCWAFAPIGAVEAYTNLYYNQLLDLDLSEQDIVSCADAGVCGQAGGFIEFVFPYLKDSGGVVNEACFEYTASKPSCNCVSPFSPCKCSFPDEKIRIGNYTQFYNTTITADDLKKLVIQAPMTYGVKCWWHFLGLIGFKMIQEGDSIFIKTSTQSRWVTITSGHSLIGSDAWILKNSYGTSWGDNGFGYVVTDWSEVYGMFSISGHISSLNYTSADRICEDRDGDGYYYWGVGSKPATCPACAPNQPDGDDSNPNLGTMDEYGNCAAITPLVEIITTSQTWNTDKILCKSIAVQSGVTLTIVNTSTVFTSNYTITVEDGGRLILSGGTIDDGNIIVQNGGEFTISNDGKVLLGNYDNLDVELGAVFNLSYGEILLK